MARVVGREVVPIHARIAARFPVRVGAYAALGIDCRARYAYRLRLHIAGIVRRYIAAADAADAALKLQCYCLTVNKAQIVRLSVVWRQVVARPARQAHRRAYSVVELADSATGAARLALFVAVEVVAAGALRARDARVARRAWQRRLADGAVRHLRAARRARAVLQ